MAGRQKSVSPPRVKTWADEVVALYVRHPDMEALSGERPEHPDLPAWTYRPTGPFLGPVAPLGMETRGELR